MSAHTPGPWETFGGGGLVRAIEGKFATPIAEVRPPYRPQVGLVRGDGEQRANARLIAAAPDYSAAAGLCRKAFAGRRLAAGGLSGLTEEENAALVALFAAHDRAVKP